MIGTPVSPQSALAQVAALDPKRRELLLQLLKRAPGAPRRRKSSLASYPLSFAQQRLWLVDQLEPKSPRYNVPECIRLRGSLNRSALAQALTQVVMRHEVLRTCFAIEGGQPRQLVQQSLTLSLEELDVSALPPAQREGAALQRAAELARQPFDLTATPLLRAHLICLGPDDHLFLLNVHHIVYDGWSREVLAGELAAGYSQALAKKPQVLPPLVLQYPDYALWQSEQGSGAGLGEHVDYFRRELAGIPAVLALPADLPVPAAPSHAGGQYTVTVDEPARQAFHRLCADAQVTPFVAMTAAWAALLHLWTGQPDIVLGVPFANRLHPQLEPLIGFFVNMLPLRLRLHDDPAFASLLQQARQVTMLTTAHQAVPFERLVEALKPPRALGRNPLFQVSLAVTAQPAQPIELPGLTAEPVALDAGVTAFDLSLFVREEPQRLTWCFVFSSELFLPQTIARLSRQLGSLVRSAARDPQRKISELQLAADSQEGRPAARGRLAPIALDARSLPQAVGAHAASFPEAVAVSAQGRQLTYGQLERRAQRLAARLVARGLGPGDRIGLVVPQTLDLPVCVLGILKSGAAYVPIDPSSCSERIASLLADAQVGAVVVAPEFSERVGELPQLWIDDADTAALPAAAPMAKVPAEVPADALACVMYPAGSAGQPRGIWLSHRNVQELFAQTEQFGFARGDVWLLLHTCGTDFSLWELWGALLHGSRLEIAAVETLQAPAELYSLVAREQVTVLCQLAAEFSQFVQADERAGAQLALRWILLEHARLESARLHSWLTRHPDELPQLASLYGPMAGTILAATRRLTSVDLKHPASSSIGTPLAGRAIYLLDRHHRPVPEGIVGEIYLGGAGVGSGDPDRPAHAAERFIRNPFSPDAGLLYRTGDLGRYRSDGELELVAELPEITGGRFDRQALPAKDENSSRVPAAPTTTLEESLRRLFAAVLSVAQVGVEDDFFALGGHSLLGIELLHRIRQELGCQLPLASLLRAPSARQLASLIATRAGDRRSDALVPLRQGDATPALYLLHPAGGQLLGYRSLVVQLPQGGAIFGLQALTVAGAGAEPVDIAAMCHAYADAILQSPGRGARGAMLLGWSMGGVLALGLAAELLSRGIEVKGVVLYDSYLIPANDEADADPIAVLCQILGTDVAARILALPVAHREELGAQLAKLATSAARHAYTLQWAREHKFLPAGLPSSHLDKEIDLAAHHYQMLRGYTPPQTSVPLFAFWASEPQAAAPRAHTPWGRFTTGPYQEAEAAGNHYTMMRMPQVKALAVATAAVLSAWAAAKK